MIALQYQRFGEPSEVVAPVDLPVPQPGEGEVRLRLLLSPIHNHDLAKIRGLYGERPELPALGGSEMLGVVEAVGAGVTGLKVGTRVATFGGAWAEQAIVRAPWLFPVPREIPDEAAAQLLAMPLSAVVLFDDLAVRPGDWIVQNAANGAVGRVLVRVAQNAGVNVVNLVRSRSGADLLHECGAEHIVLTDGNDDWPKQARDAAGGEFFAAAVDSLCDANSRVLNRLVAPRGTHVIFGALGGRALALDPGALIFGERVVRGFWTTAWRKRATPQEQASAVGRVVEMALRGDLPLPVASIHPLAEGKQALAAAEAPGRPGKILLSP